ncbi:hypothetical protein [Bacillus atrophaeus]
MSRTLGIVSHNQTARKWLTVLRQWEKTDSETLPRPIRAVCTNALENSTAKFLITIPDHPYLLLKASLLKSTAEPGQIAVSFEPAAPPDTMPLLIDACGLTERETDITDRRAFNKGDRGGLAHFRLYSAGSFEVNFCKNGDGKPPRADVEDALLCTGISIMPAVRSAGYPLFLSKLIQALNGIPFFKSAEPQIIIGI